MRAAIPLMMVFVARMVFADAATDRASIEQVIRTVFAEPAASSEYFTRDADNDLGMLPQFNRGTLRDTTGQIWSELSMPILTIGPIRLLDQDVALVEAANTQ